MDCQRCRQPLVAWGAAGSLGRGLLGESYVVLPQSRRPSTGSGALPDSLNESLARPSAAYDGVLQASSIHEQLRTVDRLVGLAERCAAVPCGVPLCEECASGVLRELNRRLDEAHVERDLLQAAFAEIEAGDGDALCEPLGEAESEAEGAARAREMAELRASLAAAKRERAALVAEAARLRQLQLEQEREEEAWHAELNASALVAQRAAEEALRSRQLVDLCTRELGRLEHIDVCEDVFCISATGAFGTINALRLGRLPGVAVDWAEINAALGQVNLAGLTRNPEHGIAITNMVRCKKINRSHAHTHRQRTAPPTPTHMYTTRTTPQTPKRTPPTNT